MGHFAAGNKLKKFYRGLQAPRAAVTVEILSRKDKTLRICGGISVLKADAEMGYLPEGWTILPPEGSGSTDPIKPTGRFLVTLESIDPNHMVTDWWE